MLLFLACTPADTGAEPGKEDTGEPASLTFCERVRGGAPGGRDPAVELAEAHGRLRYFGPDKKASDADSALAAALVDAPPSDDEALLRAYLGDDEQKCLVEASGSLGPAAATVAATGVAWVTPGTGTLALPSGATSVVVDLRGLPAGADTDAAIRAALSLAMGSPVTLPEVTRRTWGGSVDQLFSENNAYEVNRLTSADSVEPAGGSDLPLFVVTETNTAPEAARWAAALRAVGRAAVVGADVETAMGELEWVPVGGRGFAYHARDIDVVDLVPADVASDAPEDVFADGAPSLTLAELEGDNTRDSLNARQPWTDDEMVAFDVGAARAALLTVHGAIRLFFPYFDVVGDGSDARLLEVLDGVETDDEQAFERRLGRYGEVLRDGHVFFGSLSATGFVGYAPVQLDHLGGLPVVQRSNIAEIVAGDTLVAVDGVPIEQVQADFRAWNGAATEGYTLDFIARRLVYMYSAQATWTMQGLDGTTRDVVVEAGTYDETLWYAADQPSGMLDGEIAYVNLDSAFTTSVDEITALLAEAPKGVILDMRGYPGINHYEVPALFTADPWFSPQFSTPVRNVDSAYMLFEQYDFVGGEDPYTGPVVLLVGPHSVSAAENFSQMMVATGRVTVIGRQSAGTNGNITGIWLPGGAYFSWTGMQVLNPDGSVFHGVGIVPDIQVDPTPADYAAGYDATVAAAITALGG